jgi:dipeptidyl aminopeptidase/acylaminoacyl peptidase
MSLKTFLCHFGVSIGLAIGLSAHAATPADIPASSFFKWPTLSAPVLSPDGKRIALIVPGPDGRKVLALADVATPQKRVGVAHFNDADIQSVWWINNDRLAFNAIDYQSALGEQFGGGLYAVDADGSDFIYLVGRGRAQESEGHIAIRPLRWNHRIVRLLRDGSEDVIVERVNVADRAMDLGSRSLLRLNTRTRATRQLVSDEPRHAQDWALNPAGEPLAVRTVDEDGNARVLWRPEPRGAWTELARYNAVDGKTDDKLTPLAVTTEGQLLVRALRNDAARTAVLATFDPVTRKLAAQPVVGLDGFDFDGVILFDRVSGKMAGATFTTDAEGVAWLDPALRDVQKRIDELLPNTANVFVCDPCGAQQRFVVTAWSDRQVPVYFLFDKQAQGKAALTLIGPSRPSMDAALMAEQDFQRIPSRDGKQIPVYITKPKGKGPWPTVVMVHGGPWVRGGSWGWQPEAQFLASRGYLVVEPEFRGSLGFGDAWHRASFKQWGLTMQDDVTDATRWAVAKGWADPKRMAIAGGSYGGYATMMGLVKEPELYRAGVNIVGVTDIELMYSIGWSDFAGSLWQREEMPRQVGDPNKDRDLLRAASPLLRAAEITKPVLMAYGGRDFRVPLPHGTQMRDAIRKAGKTEVEWIEYELEGHGFLLEANRVDFWTRVEKFLAKNLR